MTSVISKYVQVYNAKQFKESVSEPDSSNVYLTFGKSTPWPDENNPPQANTSVVSFLDVWNNMIGGKRFTGNDIRHAIPRHNWTANTVFVAYDDLLDSNTLKDANSKFYVITDDNHVYKCLANNYGANSTTKPTQTTTASHFQTDDKYIWKYMYTLTNEELNRFTTSDYIPVRTIYSGDNSPQWNVQEDAAEGAIHVILVTNSGTNYTNSDNIIVTITGDGVDANAVAVRDATTNTITEIIVSDKGAAYTYANVAISGGGGSGATARAIMSPSGGHGSDALTELGGSYLVIHITLNNDEDGTLIVNNEFRQIAMIEDPYYYGTSNIAGNTVISQLMGLSLSGTSVEYTEDERVYQGTSYATSTFRGTVVTWDSSNNYILMSNIEGTPAADLLTGVSSSASRYVNEVTYPDLEHNSGKLLYIDNITPIERSSDQNETFQIVLSF